MTFARSLAYAMFFYAWSLLVALVVMPPLLLCPRPWIRGALRVWGWVIIWGLRVICGLRLEVRGLEHLPKGASLIAAKHQCMFDTMAPFVYLPDACIVLKKELTRIPIYGWVAVKDGNVVVDREGHAAALRKLVSDCHDRLAEARQLIIFPEGHRMAPGEAPDYKPGIAALYRELAMPCTPMATNSGVHWPAHGFLRKPGVIVFEFLEPIPPGLKRGAFMVELERRIETATGALLESGV